MDSRTLRHHGVKGMRWGVRRKRKRSSQMTDEELNAAIKRANLEKRYEEVYKESATISFDTDRAKKFVTRVAEKSGNKLVPQLANYYGVKISDFSSDWEEDDDDE